ncbi:TetR/AcrR family transcriptional regulator [Kutzneria sp. NPDC052558]|uniref:TetR/AcrR family transcriptional regulator n=1 Tax=Kutzneria sp. NPDC052558 TaxID=3364121 RepID=UPI0037C50EC9
MGLREKKAQKVREAIYDAMLTLVERHGYDAATVEQVAEHAEVGISTVYRYFENKDAILLDPIERNVTRLADLFRTRPDDEDVAVSLGSVVHSALDLDAATRVQLRRLRTQLSHAPGPRARLWDFLHRQRLLLEDAIAERSDRGALWNSAAAHLTTMIISMASNHAHDCPDDSTPADYADQVIAILHGADSPLPRRQH